MLKSKLSIITLGLLLPLMAQFSSAQSLSIPDLSGVWQISNPPAALLTSDGKEPPLTEKGRQLYSAHKAAKARGNTDYDTMTQCVPPGVPRLAMQPFPFQFIQGKRHVGIMYEWNHLPRKVYMAEGHYDGIGPVYLGQSVGWYEGDTLVIDTNQFNDYTLLDDSGLPHSDQLETVERYRLIDGGKRLELLVTITDPIMYSQPWEARLTFDQMPEGTIVKEDYCLRRLGRVE